jgi:hypothetical protein
MKNIIPYNPSFELGKGFNSLKGEALGTIFQSDLVYSDPRGFEGQKVDFKMSRIEDVETLYEELGISIESSGRYGLFSASAKFNFAQSSNFNSYSVFYLLSVKVENAVKHIKKYELNPTVAQWLTDGKTEKFLRGFGDSYISGMITGGEFFAVYEFVCTDESSKTQIGAQLEAEYGSAMFTGVEVSAKFNSTVSSASKKSQLKLTTYQSGGVGQRVVTNPEEMIARAKEFPNIVKGDQGVAYAAILQSYETLPLPEGPNYVELENKTHVLDSYAKDIIKWRQKLVELDYIIEQPEEFDFEDEKHMEAIVDQRTALANIIKACTLHASNCADSISKCDVFNPSPDDLKMLTSRKLPSRKKTLDYVVIYDGINYTGNANYLTKGKYKDGNKDLGLGNDKIKSIKVPKGWQVTLFQHWYFDGINLPLTESCPDLSVHRFTDLTSSIFIGDIGETVAREEPPAVAPAAPAPAVGASRFAKLKLSKMSTLASVAAIK